MRSLLGSALLCLVAGVTNACFACQGPALFVIPSEDLDVAAEPDYVPPDPIVVAVGEQLQLAFISRDGTTVKDLTQFVTSWTSADDAIATVDAAGVLSGVARGETSGAAIATPPDRAALPDDTHPFNIRVLGAPDDVDVKIACARDDDDTVIAGAPARISCDVTNESAVAASADVTTTVPAGVTTSNATCDNGCSADDAAGAFSDFTIPPGIAARLTLDVTADAGGTFDIAFEVSADGDDVVDDNLANVALAVVGLDALTVAPDAPTLLEGDAPTQFTATGALGDGSSLDITDLVTWSSSDPAVLPIDGGGEALPASGGTATITATLGTVSDSTEVFVDSVASLALTLAPGPYLGGFVYAYTVEAAFVGGALLDVTEDATVTVEPPTCATVDDDLDFFAISLAETGPCRVIASFGGASDDSEIETVIVLAVDVGLPQATAAPGTQLQLDAIATFGAGVDDVINVTDVCTWTSSADAAATVDAGGLVTTVAPGDATFTCTIDAAGVSGESDVLSVVDDLPDGDVGVTLTIVDGGETIIVGESTPVTVVVENHGPADLPNVSVSVTDLDGFGTLAAGAGVLCTPIIINGGERIDVSCDNLTAGEQRTLDFTYTATLTLAPVRIEARAASALIDDTDATNDVAGDTAASHAVTSITIAPSPLSVAVGAQLQATATAGFDDGGAPLDITRRVTWASSNEAFATVSNAAGTAGLVDGVAAGSGAITATFTADPNAPIGQIGFDVTDVVLGCIAASNSAPAGGIRTFSVTDGAAFGAGTTTPFPLFGEMAAGPDGILFAASRGLFAGDPSTVGAFAYADDCVLSALESQTFAGLKLGSIVADGNVVFLGNDVGPGGITVLEFDPGTTTFTPVAGSPFATGGFGVFDLTLNADGTLLGAAVGEDVATFTVDPTTRALAQVSITNGEAGFSPAKVRFAADGTAIFARMLSPQKIVAIPLDPATGTLDPNNIDDLLPDAASPFFTDFDVASLDNGGSVVVSNQFEGGGGSFVHFHVYDGTAFTPAPDSPFEFLQVDTVSVFDNHAYNAAGFFIDVDRIDPVDGRPTYLDFVDVGFSVWTALRYR